MNPHVKIAAVAAADISPAEWQARIDLAAAYRLIAHYGWGDVIYNHSSMRVPGAERKFLIKRHALLYTEVTPANLVKVSMDDDLDESAGVNRPGFTLHGGVLSARPDVNCAVHVHTEIGMAIAGLQDGLRMVSQAAIRFYNRVGDHAYEGITEDFAERAHRQGTRRQPSARAAQPRAAHGRPDRARSLRLDENADRGRAYPAHDGSDRQHACRNPGGNLRKDRAPIRASRFRPRLGGLAGLPAHARPDRSELAELSRS